MSNNLAGSVIRDDVAICTHKSTFAKIISSAVASGRLQGARVDDTNFMYANASNAY